MPARNTVALGALGLVAALWPVVVPGARERHAVVPGLAALAAVVVAAVALAGAGARPSAAALDWQSWDLLGRSSAGRTVQLVWASTYAGVDFRGDATTVLRVHAPRRAHYWRATTLDRFAHDRWSEALSSTAVGSGVDERLPLDTLLPRAALRQGSWVRQDVDVGALVDDHLVAAGQPMRVETGDGHRIQYLSGGVMRSTGDEVRHYRVWSYVPDPSPSELLRSPRRYPYSLERYLDAGDGRLAAYRPLRRRASEVAAGAASPYEQTERIERWLRNDGGFTYDEHPPDPGRVPPLVDFVQRTRRGYCQQFAGTMALMLRYLGIPSRVAVGFTSGRWKDGAWTVTDHDAHAWVEAWFSGYGWLTFDPTPGRGRLAASYTSASSSAATVRDLGAARFADAGRRRRAVRARPTIAVAAPARVEPSRPYPVALVVLAALLAVPAGLALVKEARRRRRSGTADPRRRASAARAELVDFVRDQGATLSPHAPVPELTAELRRLGVAAEGFATAFARARYGPADRAGAAAEEARAELGRIVDALRQRIGRRRRILGLLRIRSLRGG